VLAFFVRDFVLPCDVGNDLVVSLRLAGDRQVRLQRLHVLHQELRPDLGEQVQRGQAGHDPVVGAQRAIVLSLESIVSISFGHHLLVRCKSRLHEQQIGPTENIGPILLYLQTALHNKNVLRLNY
jgi:hypothetical protein